VGAYKLQVNHGGGGSGTDKSHNDWHSRTRTIKGILRTHGLANKVTHIYMNKNDTESSGLYTGKWVFLISHFNALPPTFPWLVEVVDFYRKQVLMDGMQYFP
jgi:hypothetical protein